MRILSGIEDDYQKACNTPVFKKCQFSNFKLDFSIINSISDESYLQNESVTKSKEDSMMTDQYFSLNEVIQEFKPSGNNNSGKIYLQVYQDGQKRDQSTIISDLTLNNSIMTQKTKLLRKKQRVIQSCKVDQDQIKVEERLQKIFLDIQVKEKQKNQLNFTKGWSVFEVKIRPVYYLSKVCYMLQITPLNNVMYKVIKSVTEKQSLLPQIFTNYEQMIPLNQIVNYTQLIEQQLSELSGIPSRTTVIDISNSSLVEQDQNPTENQSQNQKKTQKLNGLSQHTFARYQFYLTSAWCNAVQISYQYKSQLNAWHIQNKSILLNFQKVSRKTQSIENHVKEFLIQFSQQIEFKNIHVSVCQGKMPNDHLYTDWKLYNQILFQIFSNAVKFNKTDGAIAVSIYFVKELRVTNSNGNKKHSNQDNFEIGRLVTVVKDTGIGISQQNLNGLFKIKTKISKRGITNMRSHMLKPSIEGLGLQTAQNLAKCLGGKILVKSKLDCGTHVTFDVQVTVYPVKRLQPEYEQIRTDSFILKLPLYKDNSFYQQKSKIKKKLPITIFDDSQIDVFKEKIKLDRDSIGESEIFTCDEAGKEFEYAMKKLDLFEVKSEGDQPFYRPKPPQRIFFEEDCSYLDDSEIQRKQINDKSEYSQSQAEQQQIQKEETKEVQQQTAKKDLYFDVLSNQSHINQPEGSATVDYSMNIDALNKSSLITGKQKMLSFADVIRSSMSKQSPMTAMINSVPSMDYSNAPRRFMSSSISLPKKGKQSQKDLINATRQRRPAKKNALSFDNVIPKGKKSQNDLQQVRQELISQQNRNRSVHHRIKNDESQKSEEEKAKQSNSGSDNQAKQKVDGKLHFPIIFSSGQFSQQPSQKESPNESPQVDPEINMQQMRSVNFAQNQPDFTFQNKQSISHSHQNSSVGMGSVAVSLQQVSHCEDSNRKLQLEQSRSQQKQLVHSDENNHDHPRQDLSVPSIGNMQDQILNHNQIEPILDSEHQFSDLSIGESERQFELNHNFQQQSQNNNMLKLLEPPLQLLHQGIIGLLKDKGLAIFDKGQNIIENNPQNSNLDQSQLNLNIMQPNKILDPYLSLIGDLEQSLEQFNKRKQSSSGLDARNSGSLQDQINFQPKSKQAELKMKSLFSQLPSVKKPNSKVVLKDSAQSVEKKFCQCKSVLFVDDDPATEKIVRETIELLDQRGIDIAKNSNQAMHILSLKLQAQCCTDTYDLIFVALDCSSIEYNLIQRIIETIDLWNQKLKSKGKPPIEQPHIVGISTEEMTRVQRAGTNSCLTKPLNQQMISEIYTQLGSYLL